MQPLQKPEPAKKARQCCGGRCSRCPGASLVSCCFSWTLTDVKNFLVQIPQVYCETLARRPWAFLLLWAIAVLIVLPMMWRPIVVNADIDAFRRADAPAARGHLAYLDALKFMRAVKNESALGQRTMLKVEILYEAKDGSVFSESVLRDIRAFEQSLRSLAGWSALCNMSEPALQFHCNPGDSMGNYVWPRRLDDFLNAQGFFRLAFDGSALERLPMDAVIAYLSEGLAAPHDLRMFLPMTFAEPSSGSKTLRSVFGFAAPDLNDTAFREAFQDFVQNELYSSLLQAVIDTRKPVDPSSWDQPPAIRIYFRGDMLDEHELLEALYSDMLLAIGPLFISLVVAWVKLRSALLALVGTTFLCLAALLAYIILPVQEVSPASLLGIFLLFGLGFSSIFRMQEVWRRSRNEAEEHSQRLLYVHWAALREMLPVAGSAICYVLLRDSKLVPLREFGVFIGTSIFLACAFALLCFVPFLLMHERSIRPWIRRKVPKKLVGVLEPAELKPDWSDVAEKVMLAVNRPKPVLAGAGFAVAVALIVAVAVTASQPHPALPEVFPPEHHREAGRPMLQSFAPSSLAEEEAPLTIRMCEPGRGLDSCVLHWCDLENTPSNNLTSWPASQAATCRCYSQSQTTASCTNISLSLVVSGPRPASLTQDVLHAQALSFVATEYADANSVEITSATSRRLQSVVLEDWPSGTTQVDPLTQLPPINLGFATARRSSSSCEDAIYCYCSPKSCTTPSGYRRTVNDLTLPAPPESADSTLQPQGRPSLEVIVLFGISQREDRSTLSGTFTAAFDPDFDPASPWSQRAMLRVCNELPSELNILSSNCWIQDFRNWLVGRGQKFPVDRFLDFHLTLKEFLVGHPSAASAMWLNEANNLTATMFTFQVVPTDGADATLEMRDRWLNYITGLNSEATSTAAGAWVTCQAWVDMEALKEALDSSWQVLINVSLVVAGVGILCTLDLELVLGLLVVAFGVCAFIVFFFFALCGWSFGPWELTIMTVFLSYSVEPAFQMGYDFVMPGMPRGLRPENNVQPAEGMRAIAAGGDLALAGSTHPESPGTGAEAGPSTDGLSKASDLHPKEDELPEAAVKRSVHAVAKNLISNSIKLMLCGIMLAPCQLRIFSRLGAISILLPVLCLPSVLVVYPALIIASGRIRREPDLVLMGKVFLDKASWLWT